MAVGPRLELRQTQSLVMTPQLQQAIRMLQMSTLELNTYIEQQIEQNPLLEEEDTEGGIDQDESPAERDEGDSEAGADGDAYGDDPPDIPDSVELTNSETLLENDEAALDTDYENVWDTRSTADGGDGPGMDAAAWNQAGGRPPVSEDNPDFDNLAAKDITLRDHLLAQANVDFNDPIDRMIAAHLIEMLDDSGYLSGSLAPVAAALGCDEARVEQTLQLIKRFDPPGIFAADLAECLALQLHERNRLDPAIQALLDNLDLLARRDFTTLRKLCGVNSEDLLEMVNEVKALNPKPASLFDHSVAQAVTPDVLVRRGNDGEWIIELNSDTLPRVLVNSRYYAVVRKKTRNKAEKEFLVDCYQSANWLVKSLQQRARTILKVATELVVQQSGFFSKGVHHLKPLTLHDIAEVVGVHESTVSRATNNKYLGMSRGIYEMKYFFTTAIGQIDTGGIYSAESIRLRIKEMIADEPADAVLSDDKIVDILRHDGVEIARRTVAKYRESMRIPSSVQRRRDKILHAL